MQAVVITWPVLYYDNFFILMTSILCLAAMSSYIWVQINYAKPYSNVNIDDALFSLQHCWQHEPRSDSYQWIFNNAQLCQYQPNCSTLWHDHLIKGSEIPPFVDLWIAISSNLTLQPIATYIVTLFQRLFCVDSSRHHATILDCLISSFLRMHWHHVKSYLRLSCWSDALDEVQRNFANSILRALSLIDPN